MSLQSEYLKARQTYHKLADRASDGDREAMRDKQKAHQEVRALERQGARDGQILNSTYKDGVVSAATKETHNKADLQREYCRKFNDEIPVVVSNKDSKPVIGEDGKPVVRDGKVVCGEPYTSMAEYHRRRLLGK